MVRQLRAQVVTLPQAVQAGVPVPVALRAEPRSARRSNARRKRGSATRRALLASSTRSRPARLHLRPEPPLPTCNSCPSWSHSALRQPLRRPASSRTSKAQHRSTATKSHRRWDSGQADNSRLNCSRNRPLRRSLIPRTRLVLHTSRALHTLPLNNRGLHTILHNNRGLHRNRLRIWGLLLLRRRSQVSEVHSSSNSSSSSSSHHLRLRPLLPVIRMGRRRHRCLNKLLAISHRLHRLVMGFILVAIRRRGCLARCLCHPVRLRQQAICLRRRRRLLFRLAHHLLLLDSTVLRVRRRSKTADSTSRLRPHRATRLRSKCPLRLRLPMQGCCRTPVAALSLRRHSKTRRCRLHPRLTAGTSRRRCCRHRLPPLLSSRSNTECSRRSRLAHLRRCRCTALHRRCRLEPTPTRATRRPARARDLLVDRRAICERAM
jgi:hypothetical protein